MFAGRSSLAAEYGNPDMPKTALITGITGQDGAFLAEFLLAKGYTVHGIKRRTSLFNTDRIDHLYEDPHIQGRRFFLHYGDLTDSSSLVHVMQQVQPDEVYNLGAQSHVAVSFEEPEYTANSDAMGALRLLEAIRILGLGGKTRFYQASTSEMFGLVSESPQNESTPFHPRSPYGVAKLYAHWITVNYRESYGIFACNGILFNHESPIRGETFVTRKITRALPRIVLGLQDCLYLGNLDARRDWGHARDYVRAMWLMLQQTHPGGFRHRHRTSAQRSRVRHRRRVRARAGAGVGRQRARRSRTNCWNRPRARHPTRARRNRRPRRPPVLSTGRGGHAAGRCGQGQDQTRLDSGRPIPGTRRGDGARRPSHRAARRARPAARPHGSQAQRCVTRPGRRAAPTSFGGR